MSDRSLTLFEVHLHDGFKFRVPVIDERLGGGDDAGTEDAGDDAASDEDGADAEEESLDTADPSSGGRRGGKLLKTGTLVAIVFLARKLKNRDGGSGGLRSVFGDDDFDADEVADYDDEEDPVSIEVEDDDDDVDEAAGRGKGGALVGAMLLIGMAFVVRKLLGGDDEELDELDELDDLAESEA